MRWHRPVGPQRRELDAGCGVGFFTRCHEHGLRHAVADHDSSPGRGTVGRNRGDEGVDRDREAERGDRDRTTDSGGLVIPPSHRAGTHVDGALGALLVGQRQRDGLAHEGTEPIVEGERVTDRLAFDGDEPRARLDARESRWRTLLHRFDWHG